MLGKSSKKATRNIDMKYLTYNKDVELVHSLNICGCGTPSDCYTWVIEYLTDLKEYKWDKYSYEDDDWKLIQIINGNLEKQGFVEHGTTCRCSWLTKLGEKLLSILKYMQKYDFDFNPDSDTEYGKWFWVEMESEK